MARDVQNPLFPTLSPSRKLFLRFHFIAQNFVEAVSSYIYDIAIGSNFDAFLSTASPSRTSSKGSAPVFSDIFTLAEQHSALLDVILGACLLRSSQRAEGELLRGSLDMILELALLMADLKQGTYQEYQASTLLEKLFKLFRSRMTKLVCYSASIQHHLFDHSHPLRLRESLSLLSEVSRYPRPRKPVALRPQVQSRISRICYRTSLFDWTCQTFGETFKRAQHSDSGQCIL